MTQKIYCVVKRLFEGSDKEGKAYISSVHFTWLDAATEARMEYDKLRRDNNALGEWSEFGDVRGLLHCNGYSISIYIRESEVEI